MAIARTQALKLLSATESRLYEASRRGRIGEHNEKRLQKLAEAGKKQLEKLRAALEKQRARPNAGRAVESSVRKLDVIEEIVTRLESALTRAQGNGQTAAAKAARKKASPVKRASKAPPAKAARKKPLSATPSAAKSARKKKAVPSKLAQKATRAKKGVSARAHAEQAPKGAARRPKGQISAELAHQAHSASRGRRNQAKRDKRG